MRAMLLLVTSLVAIALVSACQSAPRRITVPEPTLATPTPTPTIDRTADLTAAVVAARLRPADLGVNKPVAEQDALLPAMPCDYEPPARPIVAHSWRYAKARPDILSHAVFAYDPQPGALLIAVLKPALTTCKAWIWGDTWSMTVVGEFTATRPAGTDGAVTYCHLGTILSGATKGDKAYLCDGYVSRGPFVAAVSAVKLTLSQAQSEVRKALPLAAAALLRAAPATPTAR